VDRELPKEEWLQFFGELNRCAVINVTLQGGEPFCRKDLKEIIDGIVCNRMRFNVLSNGTLINDEISAFLASTGRCDGVQVSIDGSIPVIHDAFRGTGNFTRSLEGIKSLQNYNVPVDVRVTVHRKNVHDLDGIAKLLLDRIGLKGFSTNSASFMGLCRRNTQMVQLTTDERSLAMQTLLNLNAKYHGRISAAAGPLAEGRTWLMMEKARKEGNIPMPGGGSLTACSGPMDTIAVRADGVMVPCIQMSHIELGRINKDDLKEVWQGHPELKRLRDRKTIPLSNFQFCRDCTYINYCTGNCPALAYMIVGEENHPSPDACLRRFLEEGGSLPDQGSSC
jgi:SynChlorMet cassette radical SAM/SPASM protein ScmE